MKPKIKKQNGMWELWYHGSLHIYWTWKEAMNSHIFTNQLNRLNTD